MITNATTTTPMAALLAGRRLPRHVGVLSELAGSVLESDILGPLVFASQKSLKRVVQFIM